MENRCSEQTITGSLEENTARKYKAEVDCVITPKAWLTLCSIVNRYMLFSHYLQNIQKTITVITISIITKSPAKFRKQHKRFSSWHGYFVLYFGTKMNIGRSKKAKSRSCYNVWLHQSIWLSPLTEAYASTKSLQHNRHFSRDNHQSAS